MLCEITAFGNPLATWLALSAMGIGSVVFLSLPPFVWLYVYPTYHKWTRKSNAYYPSADKVRDEIIQTIKGVWVGTFWPALSLYFTYKGWNQAYCGVEPYGWGWLALSTFLIFLITDFLEWYYHRLGHTIEACWLKHKYHHVFFNPTPFAVIADEYVDQFVRAFPLFLIPMIFPVNQDLLWAIFITFFYGYGVFIHSGHEVDWLSAHNWLINTPYQHYIHHAKARLGKPYHTGFFVKIWDRMAGSLYDGPCTCAVCERENGKRTEARWNTIQIPDYSVLMDWRYMLYGPAVEGEHEYTGKTFEKKELSKVMHD
jgi:lathosterol oxidase